MNRYMTRLRVLTLTSALTLAASSQLSAQSTAPAAPAKGPENDTAMDEIVLSPFIISADEDKGGYGATSTLAGSRVRTDLKDVASSITVVTPQFLIDTGAKNAADLLVYTPSTEVAGLRGNFSGVAGNGIYQENTISSTTRVRGLDSADNTRDYFLTDIPWDGFNVGRVDLQRGPNSILFGTGSPAGIINTSINDAVFKTAYHVANRLDEWGSVRTIVDLNQNIIPQVFSVRASVVKDNEKYEQKPAYNKSNRYYGALRFDPKLFNDESHTSFRAKFENGRVNSNNPRTIPPGDDYTRWFNTKTDAYGNPGYNKIIINQFTTANPLPAGFILPGGATTAPGGKGGALANALALANQGRSFWPDVINYYEGNGALLKTIVAQPAIDLGMRDANGGTLGGVNPNFLPLAIPMMTGFANSANIAPIPGGVYYSNVVLQDPSIYNFYKKLLDGPNKHEWQNWKAYNLAFDQSFLNGRLAFQIAFDQQTYTSGALQWMTGENYNINIDINATYADGSPNPNVGRPYAGNGASAPGLNNEATTDRTTIRFTPTAELRASDFLGNTTLAKILGKHNFTGLYERNKVTRNSYNYAEFATTPQYVIDNNRNDATHIPPLINSVQSGRSFEWINYLGPSLINNPYGVGANLDNIKTLLVPPNTQTALNFNARWNKPTTVGTAGYVDPTAPYTYSNYVTGATITGTQVDNPANYIGWSAQPITWMKASNPNDLPGLVEGANRTRFRNLSKGITWQGYFLSGDLVPTFGWRKDVITTYQTQAPINQTTGFTSLDFLDDGTSRTDVRGESKTWGIVYHLPKVLTAKLPWETTISLFFDKGKNFKADATRLNMAGLQMPNANGDTKEYGVTITTLHDKLSLKVAKFKTKVSNATLADTQGNSIGGLGQNAYFIADGSIWGYGWATYLQDALRGTNGATLATYGDYAGADGFTRNTPAEIAKYDDYNRNGGTAPNGRTYIGGLKVVDAWLHAPFPSSFFGSYNLTPNIIPTLGTASGNLRDSYPSGYNDAGGPQLGGGSSFGNHQTTVDNLSDGYELELNYRPTKNWNITANYSKVNATHENIDPVSVQFIGALTKFMNGPGGQIREWFNGDTGMLVGQWNSSIVAPYAVLTNELGHEAPEISPWRLNLVSTYTFDHGTLKGVKVGGAFREEGGRILGYHFNKNLKNSISSDSNFSDVVALTLGGLDVNQPFRGKNDTHFDAWVGYSRKVSSKIVWNIQLNIQDVGEKDRLITAKINPDGSIALARIAQGMGFRLENSFDF